VLAALRQDSLWEVPVGQQAQEMAADPAVRQVGGTVATDLGWLSGQVRALADRLGVVLPSQPTPDQQSWLVEIASKSGPDYDRTMVNRLRSACADSLQAITRAASTTRNEQVRQLADQAGQVVGRHIRYLDDLRLPGSAAVPSQTPAAGLGSVDGGNGPDRTLVALTVLVALAAAIAVLGLVWLVRFGPRPHWPVWSRRSVGSRGPWPGGGPRWPVRGARWPGGGPRWLLGPRRPFGPRRPLGPRRRGRDESDRSENEADARAPSDHAGHPAAAR